MLEEEHIWKRERALRGAPRALVRPYRCCSGPGRVKSFLLREKIPADTYKHGGQEGCARVHREHHCVCQPSEMKRGRNRDQVERDGTE